MESKEIINKLSEIINNKDVSIASVARKIGKSNQALTKQLSNTDMKVSTLLKIIDAMQCDVSINIVDRASKTKYVIK